MDIFGIPAGLLDAAGIMASMAAVNWICDRPRLLVRVIAYAVDTLYLAGLGSAALDRETASRDAIPGDPRTGINTPGRVLVRNFDHAHDRHPEYV